MGTFYEGLAARLRRRVMEQASIFALPRARRVEKTDFGEGSMVDVCSFRLKFPNILHILTFL